MMTKIIRFATVGSVMTLIAGCIQSQVMMVSATTAQVSVKGLQSTTNRELYNEAVRKAAEAAKEHGFPYFTVLASEDATEIEEGYVPQSSYTNKKGQTFTSGGYSYTNVKPGMNVGVSFYKQNCDGCLKTDVILKSK